MTDIVTIERRRQHSSVDPGGMLQVGPESAGAAPGPACYDKGGEKFTLTDAMLLLGLLDATTPLPGDIVLLADLSEKAAQKLGDVFDLRPADLAERVYRDRQYGAGGPPRQRAAWLRPTGLCPPALWRRPFNRSGARGGSRHEHNTCRRIPAFSRPSGLPSQTSGSITFVPMARSDWVTSRRQSPGTR